MVMTPSLVAFGSLIAVQPPVTPLDDVRRRIADLLSLRVTNPGSLAVVVALVTALVLTTASPAGAHAEIREADPERDGVAPVGTEEISITFLAFDPDGPVIIDVHGPNGEHVVTGDAEVSARDSVVTVPVKPLEEGVHEVEWSVLADDGDGQSTGTYEFTIEPAAGTGPGIWLVWAFAIGIPAFVFLRPGARKKKGNPPGI